MGLISQSLEKHSSSIGEARAANARRARRADQVQAGEAGKSRRLAAPQAGGRRLRTALASGEAKTKRRPCHSWVGKATAQARELAQTPAWALAETCGWGGWADEGLGRGGGACGWVAEWMSDPGAADFKAAQRRNARGSLSVTGRRCGAGGTDMTGGEQG